MAAEGALKAFVQVLNPQGVKVVLPDLLAALDTKKNWQTKVAALQALGALKGRAPAQMSTCLPDIIPAMTAIMGDAKPQVKVHIVPCLLDSCQADAGNSVKALCRDVREWVCCQ